MNLITIRYARLLLLWHIYTIKPGLQYFGISIKQIAPNARITHPTATLVCSIINWSIGIIDPLVYLIRRKEFREEVKNLFKLKVSPRKTGMAKGIVLESPLKYWNTFYAQGLASGVTLQESPSNLLQKSTRMDNNNNILWICYHCGNKYCHVTYYH